MFSTNDPAVLNDLRERLAALAHTQWSGWMHYLFRQGELQPDGSFVIEPWAVARWQRQMKLVYDTLPGEEQASDRAEADRVLALLQAWLKEQKDHEQGHAPTAAP